MKLKINQTCNAHSSFVQSLSVVCVQGISTLTCDNISPNQTCSQCNQICNSLSYRPFAIKSSTPLTLTAQPPYTNLTNPLTKPQLLSGLSNG